MFQAKASMTGVLATISLLVGIFSPTEEFTDAEALVGFASGENVTVQAEQSNKGLLALLMVCTVGAAAWTLTGNDEEDAAPARPAQPVSPPVEVASIELANTPESAQTAQALKRYVTIGAKNLMMVATGGSGKGLSLANMCRWRAEVDPSFVALWCDPKNDPDETGYFAHPAIRAFRFSGGKLTGPEIVEQVEKMLKQYRQLIESLPAKTPVWLILDEWTFILGKLKKHDSDLLDRVVDLLSSTISMLDAENKHIVLVGQSPLLKDMLPGEGGLAANLNTLCLFKRDDSAAKMIVKAGQAKVIPGNLANQEKLYVACDASPRDRAMFFDGQLWPTPELHNYGNYDRDERSHLGKAEVTVINYAEQPLARLTEPRDYDPTAVQPSRATADALNDIYARSPSAAKPLHPKVRHFADVVARYWEKNPDDDQVPLGRIIQFDRKLKAAASTEGRELIEKVMHHAAALNLIQIENNGGNWHILKLSCLDDFGDSGF